MLHEKKYVSLFFIICFLNSFCSIGALVGTATHTTGINKISILITYQVVGSILGFLIINFSSISFKKIFLKEYFLTLLALVSSILILTIQNFSAFWLFAILTRSTLSTVLASLMLSNIRNHTEKNIIEANRSMQLAQTLAFIVSLVLGPYIASTLGTLKIFLIDVIMLTFTFISFLSIHKIKNTAEKIHQNSYRDFKFILKDFWLLYLLIFCTWTSMGVFHVLEVPILTKRFELKPISISIFFFLVGISNIALIKGINKKLIETKLLFLFKISILGLFASLLIYLNTTNIYVLFTLSFLMGISNGLFNITQTTMLQNINNSDHRLNSFLIAKITGQLGLLLSILMVVLLKSTHSEVKTLTIAIALIALTTTMIGIKLTTKRH